MDSNVNTEDAALSLPMRAQRFVDDVRAHMAEFERPVAGPKGLSIETLSDISSLSFATVEAAQHGSSLSENFNASSGQEALEKILLNFTEFCRRKKIKIDPSLRTDIAKLFLEELTLNAQAFDCEKNVSKMAALTLNHGIECMDLRDDEEFSCFSDTPSIYRHVAVGNPKDPAAALRKIVANIEALKQDEEFSYFRDMPWVYKHVAVGNPKDPAAALRKIMADIEALEQDEEFSYFRDVPGVYKRVAVHNPKDPAAALRKIMADIEALEQDEEFACFSDTPSIYRHVAIHNPKDPAAALRKIMTDIEALEQDEEFSYFRDTPWVYRHVAVFYPKDPAAVLRRVMCGELKIAGYSVADGLFTLSPDALEM